MKRGLTYLKESAAFSGAGNTLTGHPAVESSASKGKAKEEKKEEHNWGTGQTLNSLPPSSRRFGSGTFGAGGASVPHIPQRVGGVRKQDRQRSPSPDWGVDDDEIIDIDSD